MRAYGDLTCLFAKKDIRRATELMITVGFAPAVPLSAIDAGKIPGQYLFSMPDTSWLSSCTTTVRCATSLAGSPRGMFFAANSRLPRFP